ncbi:MAG: HAD family phosphatase [Alistipes sp.]
MFDEIKNIVFDLGGVLIDLDKQRCIDAFNRLGFPQIETLIDFYYPAEIFNRLERGEVDAHTVCEYIRTEARKPEITDAQIHHAYQMFLAELPAAKLELIMQLRTAGKHTYLLSNTNEMVWDDVEAKFVAANGHPIGDYFDRIYLSYEMGDLKPSPTIFQRVIADSGIVPEQTLFIDDGEQNVIAAHALGFNVYMPQPREDFSHLFSDLLNK